jgi:hypothetical protein
MDLAAFDLADPLGAAQAAPNRALGRACARVQAQLAPLARAEEQLLGGLGGTGHLAGPMAGRTALAKAVRRHFARRSAQSGRILAIALGLIKSPRI